MPAPADWFGSWPDGDPLPGAPAAAAWVAQLARGLRAQLGTGETVASLAQRSGLSPATVRRVLAGACWPTLATAVALLDAAH